jgi:release factor glutamine methyltransferase
LHLLAALRGVTPGTVWLAKGADLEGDERARLEAAVGERAAGVPFAYVAGRVGFRSLTLRIDRRALIPRPETEGLVDLALAQARPGGIAADIGTGCGCIALALAHEGRFERVIAVERDARAAELARVNVAALAPRVPVEVREGDLLAPLAGLRLSLLVSNPPYLTHAEYDALDLSVREHEPWVALVSGPNGLEVTQALFERAADRLEPRGLVALEVDERRVDGVVRLAETAGMTVSVHDDLFGKPRYALARVRGST